MKIDYSKTYQLFQGGAFEKIWLEDETESNSPEDVRKALYSLKSQVEKFHFESNKAAEKQVEKEKQEPQSTGNAIIDQINQCTDIKVLESFVLIARNNRTKHPEIQQAYNNKLKQLQDGKV
jgi:hypothetical protein